MPRKPSCLCGDCPKCKQREYMREWYQRKTAEERRAIIARRDPEKVRANDRARYQRDRERILARNAAYKATNRDSVNARQREWERANRDKKRAHKAVRRALRDGRLVRQPCEVCGAAKVHAHHDDYSKPLEVRWLCPSHHAQIR